MASAFAGLPGPDSFKKKPSTGGGGLRDLAGRIADEVGIPRDLFFAVIQQESAWNPRAVSKAGAMGLGQLMPGTARGLGVTDPFDPEQNLRGAARYLKQQLNTFGGDVRKALAAYNAGPGNVKKYGGIPPFKETRDYVVKITERMGGALPADLSKRGDFLGGRTQLASRSGSGSFAGLPSPEALQTKPAGSFAGLPGPEAFTKPASTTAPVAKPTAPSTRDSKPQPWRGIPYAVPPGAPPPPAPRPTATITPRLPTPTGLPARLPVDQAARHVAGLGEVTDPRSAAAGFQAIGREVARPANALTAAANEMMRRAVEARARGERATVGPLDIDVTGALSDIAAGAGAGAAAFRKGEHVPVDFVSRAIYGDPAKAPSLLRAGEQLLPILYDPLNVVPWSQINLGGRAARAVAPVTGWGAAKFGEGLAKRVEKASEKVAKGLPGEQQEAVLKAGEGIAAFVRSNTPVGITRGRQILEGTFDPVLRHKEDLQGAVRQGNERLMALRRADPSLDNYVRGTGDNVLLDMAVDAVLQGRRLRPGAAPSPFVKAMMETADELRAVADNAYSLALAVKHPSTKGVTRDDWLKTFFGVNAKTGEFKGSELMREAVRTDLIKRLTHHAGVDPKPGYARVAEKADYGPLAGKYLPTTVQQRLKQVVEETIPAWEGWKQGVRKAKDLVLFQPFTPVKSLFQNMGGTSVLRQKTGLLPAEIELRAGKAIAELRDYWKTGKLGKFLQEYSDHDRAFLRALDNVKIADGTLGKFITVGNKRIYWPGVKAAGIGVAKRLNPLSDEHVFMKANEATDQIPKLAAYIALRHRGVPAKEAVELVRKHVVSYGHLPPEIADKVAVLDRSGMVMFANPPAQLMQQYIHTALNAPHLLARPGQLQERMLKAFDLEEAYRQEIARDPSKASPFVIPNPLKPESFINYGTLSPLGVPHAMLQGLADVVQGDVPFQDIMKRLAAQSAVGSITALAYNQPSMVPPGSPVRLIHPGTSPSERDVEFWEYLKRSYFPLAKAAEDVKKIQAGDPVSPDPYGETETMGQYLSRKLGAPTVKVGTRAAQRERTAEVVQARGETAQDAIEKVLAAAERVPDTDAGWQQKRRQAGRLTPERALLQLREAIDAMRRSAIDPKWFAGGKVTEAGQRHFRDQALWIRALQERAEEGAG